MNSEHSVRIFAENKPAGNPQFEKLLLEMEVSSDRIFTKSRSQVISTTLDRNIRKTKSFKVDLIDV